MPVCVALVLVLVGAACASDLVGSATPHERRSPAPTAEPATSLPSPTRLLSTPQPTPVATPHVGVIEVVEVIQGRTGERGQRVLAVHLIGDVGTSAIFRSLEIRARLEPIDGSSCAMPPVPTVLHPRHEDAVQPTLADQTRDVVVRTLGDRGPAAGSRPVATFRTGPVPSLNGGFAGWVSFHVPDASPDGFCAFDVRGTVVIVAGETTTAELPVVRVDSRDP